MDDDLRRASGSPARGDDGFAHPAFAFVAALGGLEDDVSTLCARLGLAFGSGAVLGRCRIVLDRAMPVDQVYEVRAMSGVIERKSSRRFGAADHLSLAMSVDIADCHFATVELTMIVAVADHAAAEGNAHER